MSNKLVAELDKAFHEFSDLLARAEQDLAEHRHAIDDFETVARLGSIARSAGVAAVFEVAAALAEVRDRRAFDVLAMMKPGPGGMSLQ